VTREQDPAPKRPARELMSPPLLMCADETAGIPRVHLADVGEFRELVDALGGAVIHLSPGDGQALNPFHLGEPAGEPSSEGDPR